MLSTDAIVLLMTLKLLCHNIPLVRTYTMRPSRHRRGFVVNIDDKDREKRCQGDQDYLDAAERT